MGVSGAGARRKGHSYEREIARLFTKILNRDCRRGLQCRDGAECPDVIGADPFWPEVKRQKAPNIWAAVRQAVEASKGKGMYAVAVVKRDHEKAIAAMPLDDFEELVTQWRIYKNAYTGGPI